MADNDVLKAVLENELLNDETRSQISEAFEAAINTAKETAIAEAKAGAEADIEAAKEQAIAEAREATEVEVRAELASKYVEDREAMAKALDEKVTELLAKEIKELEEDISAFRDLEVEKALEIEEEKEKLAEQFAEERKALIAKLDEYVDAKLEAELKELAEDIETVKENAFGRQMFETFVATYQDSFLNEGSLGPSTQERIREANEAKEEAESRITELEEEISKRDRETALEAVLAPLSGKRRSVMETILSKVETEKFGEYYEKMLPKVMSTVANAAEEPVVESVEDEANPETPKEDEVITELPEGTTVVTGDEIVTEDADAADAVVNAELEAEKANLRKLAGINS